MYYALTYHLKRLYLLVIQLYLNVFILIYFILNTNDASTKIKVGLCIITIYKNQSNNYTYTDDNIYIISAILYDIKDNGDNIINESYATNSICNTIDSIYWYYQHYYGTTASFIVIKLKSKVINETFCNFKYYYI